MSTTAPEPLDEPATEPGDAGLRRLDPRAIAYESAGRWVRTAVETIVLGVLAMVMFSDGWFTPTLRAVMAGFAALIVALEVVCAFVMPRLTHRFTRYRVDALGLEIRRGVLWRSVVTVSRTRIQHLDVTQGPLERNYGLGRLHVHTAGTQDATVGLHGIAHEVATALRDDLGAWTTDADGV